MAHPPLFSPRLAAAFAVLRFYNDAVHRAESDAAGDIEMKSGIGPLVLPRKTAVDPDLCRIVHALKIQQNTSAVFGLRNHDIFFIPDVFMVFGIADSAGTALVYERDCDLPGKRLFFKPIFLFAEVLIIEFKVPGAVQVHPVRPFKLWSGILTRFGLTVQHEYSPLS